MVAALGSSAPSLIDSLSRMLLIRQSSTNQTASRRRRGTDEMSISPRLHRSRSLPSRHLRPLLRPPLSRLTASIQHSQPRTRRIQIQPVKATIQVETRRVWKIELQRASRASFASSTSSTCVENGKGERACQSARLGMHVPKCTLPAGMPSGSWVSSATYGDGGSPLTPHLRLSRASQIPQVFVRHRGDLLSWTRLRVQAWFFG